MLSVVDTLIIPWDSSTDVCIGDFCFEMGDELVVVKNVWRSIRHCHGSSKLEPRSEETFMDYFNVFWG